MSQTCSRSLPQEGEIGVTARSHLKLSLLSSEARTKLSRELYAPPPHRPPGCRWTFRPWVVSATLPGSSSLPQDDEVSPAAAVFLSDVKCYPVNTVSALDHALETFGDGPTSWADSWAADPTVSGVLLALALTTGDTRWLPDLARASLILIADVLAHRFKSLWIYIALVMACAVVLFVTNKWSSPYHREPPPVAGVRTRTGTASPSALLAALDWIHQLAAVPRYCVGNSSSGTGDGHSDAASGGGQNNMRQAPDSQRHRAQPWRNTRTRISTSSSITTTAPDAVPTPGELNIMYWNIYHEFTLKLTSNEFHDILKPYDIMFFFPQRVCYAEKRMRRMSHEGILSFHCPATLFLRQIGVEVELPC
ncbi:hypothetical protein DFH08DRAFT_1034415 [Mycena albidolilacea]|uniref:Uncharacterized protein n=1 Tax=Mycena albidolilacea TaxID=1033008 RepID=A0AAD6ZFC7_9AGAR|nr:hypothetical protein DFH08DRAFT_1034415 [Mycena albidolilacea]